VPDDLEFLNRIDVRNHNVGRTTNIGVDDSVKEIELRTVLLTMERGIRETGSRYTHVSFNSSDASVLRGRHRSDARCKGQQLSEVPAIQRQILHRSFCNDGAEFGRRSLDQFRPREDLNHFGDVSQSEGDVLGDRYTDSEVKRLSLRLFETRSLNS